MINLAVKSWKLYKNTPVHNIGALILDCNHKGSTLRRVLGRNKMYKGILVIYTKLLKTSRKQLYLAPIPQKLLFKSVF